MEKLRQGFKDSTTTAHSHRKDGGRMIYQIFWGNGNNSYYAYGRKDIIDWLKILKDETITDIRKLYKSGASESVIDKYRKYIRKG